MTSIDDVLAQIQPRTETARVCLRGDLIAAHQRAQHDLHALTAARASESDLVAAADAVQAIEQAIRDATVEFTQQYIGHQAWTDLLAEHPPTEEQKAASPRRDWNPETFPHAAIAASCVAPPGMTAEKARELEERLPLDDWDRLWAATLLANLGGRDPEKSVAASAVLRRLRPSSEPASVSASDVPSSSAGQ